MPTFCTSRPNNFLTLAPISVPALLFFLLPMQQQLVFTVRASPPSIPLFPTTTPDLPQPESPTDTCSKSKPTDNLQNTNTDPPPRLKQFCHKFPSHHER